MSDQYDRVLIRLSSAEDEKLEPILAKLLPLVFEELLTQTEAAARTKIIGVLNHALTRCKGNKDIKLPVKSIVERWFSPSLATSTNAPFFRNLAVIFVDLGVPRLSQTEQIELALEVLRRFGELVAPSDRATLFLASIPGLNQMAAEGVRKEEVPRCVELITSRPVGHPGLAAFFHAATEFLLIPCGSVDAPSVCGIASASWSFWKARLKAKDSAQMVAMKIQVLRWLGALGAGPPAALVYLPSLAATVDNYDAVVTPATGNCARLDPELDIDKDDSLLAALACAALTAAPPGCENATGLLRVEPKANVPAKLRVKVLSLLQRSPGIGGATLVPYAVHLVRQGMREQEQVQLAALQLALAIAERCDPELLAATTKEVLHEVETVFWPGGGVVSMGPATPLAFRVYGAFARKLSEQSGTELEGRKLAMESAPRILGLLASNEHVAGDILEALSGLVACLRGPADKEYSEFVPLLDRLVASPKPVVRREVLRWATTLFPASAPEGRYYALRLFGDADPDIAKAAETALAFGRHDSPPFDDMCGFLASRALSAVPLGASGQAFADANGEAAGLERLASNFDNLSHTPASLPPLAPSFTKSDLARAMSFLLGLAEAEGLGTSPDVLDIAAPPVAKKPRLSEGGETASVHVGSKDRAALCLVMLLDYLLTDTLEGSASNSLDTIADGMTILEISFRGLLLASSLAGGGPDALLQHVMNRVELVLFVGGSAGGALFREGGHAVGRARRLGAVVVGALCERISSCENSPIEKWLEHLSTALDGAKGSARRAGGVLTVCEILRVVPSWDRNKALCKKALGLLLPDAETDAAVLSSACDGLRRLSERQRLVWDVLEEGGDASRQQFLEHLYSFSKPVTEHFGDTNEAEIGAASRDLIHASWRLLGQLAAWSGDGAAECVDKLMAIGRQTTGEAAAAALGLGLAAACSDPTAPRGQVAVSAQAEVLVRRLLKMVEEATDTDGEPASKQTLAEREATRRFGVVWICVLLKRLASCHAVIPWIGDVQEALCRAFIAATGGLSFFAADCGLKGVCLLYRLAPSNDARAELLKTTFSSVSNRTVVSNMFVGNADTATRREMEEKEKKDPNANNSLRISAKERVDALKDLMFLARDLSHHPLFIALLDQPAASVWTGEVFRESLDLQSPCLTEALREGLCPARLRPKLYPFYFHNNGPLRQAVVKMTASYFGCESPQQLSSKYPEEWRATAQSLVQALGSSRLATRQASIQAAQVLFRGKEWEDVGFLLDDLWSIVIKLMDDMENDVQMAVKPLVRMLRNLTLRLCDLKLSKRANAEAAMKEVVPILLKNAERHKHAAPLCFDVMREMVKTAHGTPLLEPYVQDLVPPLLTSLSMLEDQRLQYYQFHVSNANEQKGKELEAARIAASRDSESMRLLRQLVPLVTAENAEVLAPKSKDQLHRGVGANTRVGVCDFWGAICAERASAVPEGGVVVQLMLRALAGALLDPSKEVRGAAASCFASFARRSRPEELTKVVSERLMRQDQEYRTEDAQRTTFRIGLARALWEVCRRCDDSILETELKANIAAKAFALRYSDEQELRQAWEPLWNEICPSTSSGVERYHKEICAELSACFSDSISRAEKVNMSKAVSALVAQLEKMQPQPKRNEDAAVVELHGVVHSAVQTLPIFDGNGALLRALSDLSALLHRRKRGDVVQPPDEASIGLPLLLGFCSKGSLTDRAGAVKATMEAMSAVRLWGSLEDAAKLYETAAARIDELQKELEAEKREPGEQLPVRHRGKAQSPAEEYLAATLDLWASTLEQCRREADDEDDLEPPGEDEFACFIRSCLAEFYAGSLNMRLVVIRFWKRVFAHFKEERITVCSHLDTEFLGRLATAVQDATLDQRSERLRRPALEFAAALVADKATGGGLEAFKRGLDSAVTSGTVLQQPPTPHDVQGSSADGIGDAARRTMPAAEWLVALDPNTVQQEKTAVDALRAALIHTPGT